jgi:hypothetical protein
MFLKKIATFATILAVLILGAITFNHASAFAAPLSSAQKVTTTGYPVNINSPGLNNDSFNNPGLKPLIIIAKCNATVEPKDLEGWVRLSSQPTVNDTVASLSGTARQTITFVVPWNWHYKVNVNIPAGGVCSATAWLTD